MKEIEKINYGPYSKWKEIKAFSDLSDKAFSVFRSYIKGKANLLLDPINHIIYRMFFQAESTSVAIRLINSWAFNLPAFALTRIRLEQTIVCSYLIHEDLSEGLKKFIYYASIQRYKYMESALEDDSLKKYLKNFKNCDKLKETAIQAQNRITPGFSVDDDKFERKWTKYDLRSMAKKRDSLAPKEPLLEHSLEREYISLYKIASCVVHADCESLSCSFMDFYPLPSGEPVLMVIPTYALFVSSCTAHYDILQCYEILNWLKIPIGQEYQELMKEYFVAGDKYIKGEKE
jgi:hypothetical protein